MTTISLNHIQPGMVLSEDVVHANGRVLLRADSELTEQHIKIFKTWGILKIEIKSFDSESAESKQQYSPEAIEAATAKQRVRFQHCDLSHPLMAELFRLSVKKELDLNRSVHGQSINGVVAPPLFTNRALGVESSTGEGQRESLMDWTPEKLAQKILTIASLPTAYIRLGEIINDPDSSITDIVTLISGDIGLSVRLMKLVNSAFFGYPSKIDSLSRAVTVIGSKQLQDLVLATSVVDMFENVPNHLVTMESFWKHSIACGVIARVLANYRREFNVERAFVSGLLHDIGRIIMLMIIPDLTTTSFNIARSQNRLLYQTGKEMIGFDHAEAGGALLRQWQLPEQIVYATEYHHNPSAANRFKADVALIHIADIIADALLTSSSGEIFVSPLNSEAWDELGLSVNVLEPLLLEFTQQYKDTLSVVMPDINL